MGVGVFGKLPARRDYVQHGVDPRLMEALDPWLQRAMAESRDALGEGWLDAWLQAPIWRFWLGRRVAGVTALGALMPSVDGVGRYFPLCLVAADDGLPSPEANPQDAWFAAAEPLMLDALAEGGTYEALLAGLAALPSPARTPVAPDVPDDTALAAAFATARMPLMAELLDRHSCWWTPSPDGALPPRVLIRRGLPAPQDYARLIAPDAGHRLTPALGDV